MLFLYFAGKLNKMIQKMNILDGKAILGIVGTSFTTMIQISTEYTAGWWIPLIPAIPTAFYMIFKAYNEFRKIKKES
jgi:hypothetical protein